MGSWLRHPKTTQERRQWFYALELSQEYPELRVRRARSSGNLPTVYDDIRRPCGESNWKLYRKEQYRVKKQARIPETRDKFTFKRENWELCIHPRLRYRFSYRRWKRNGKGELILLIRDFPRKDYIYYRELLAYRKPKYVPHNQGNTQPPENGFSHAPRKGVGEGADSVG